MKTGIQARVPRRLHARMKRLSRITGRSMSSLLELCLKAYFEKRQGADRKGAV